MSSESSEKDEAEEFEVEEILDKKVKDGIIKYKVKWKGYPYSDCSWKYTKKNLFNITLAWEPVDHLENA